ncbi:MAG: hypothetical protein LBS79_10620 [Tannerella sp.]|jgi:hypothetical protein|nr:hypothetical protein [Tannerella sp.]
MITDYVPKKDAIFKDWAVQLVKQLDERATKLGLPSDRLLELKEAMASFNAAYDIAINPATRTPGAVERKNEMRKTFEGMLRKFVAEFITNSSKVADWERIDMGLPVHDKRPTPHPVATTYPLVTKTERLAPGHYKFHYRDVDSEESAAKPFGTQGAEFGYAITDGSKPVTYNDFIHSDFDTRTPYEKQYDPPTFGLTLTLAARWENTRGEKGPWSPVITLVIG